MKELEVFLEELKEDKLVHAVILFGSHVRGSNKPDSDVDLIIICNKTKRDVVRRGGEVFEIVYVTEEDAITYYNNNKDGAVRLWNEAKILFDRDESAQRIKDYVKLEIESKGKEKLSGTGLVQARFDFDDSLKVFLRDMSNSPVNVSYLLHQKVDGLLEMYFTVHGIWAPAPKQMMEKVKTINQKLYSLSEHFYLSDRLEEKILLFREMIEIVFIVSE